MPASKARRLARQSAGTSEAEAIKAAPAAAASADTVWDEEGVATAMAPAAAKPSTEEGRRSGMAGRISCTVFVGQLPYRASGADVRHHFKSNGVAGGMQVRLRTERDGTSIYT